MLTLLIVKARQKFTNCPYTRIYALSSARAGEFFFLSKLQYLHSNYINKQLRMFFVNVCKNHKTDMY
jgi:hypothetical protein